MRDYEFYYTQDGSIGLYSYADDDVYHSKFGALTEAWDKFILPSGLPKILNKQEEIKVLDVCFGIGYNTKALMSFVINSNENFLKKEKFLKIFSRKKNNLNNNIASIDNNNTCRYQKGLLTSNESIGDNKTISKFTIDCLEINEELVKISPLLKTVITPQEIFTRIVPKIFNCFDSYWQIKKFLSKIDLLFAPRNRREIRELLELKFRNDYDYIDNEYRIHKFVNYILVNKLVNHFNNNYIDTNLKKMLKKRKIKPFVDSALVRYSFFKQDKKYKIISKFNLFAFLHNIYYDHLSNRYKKAKFNVAEKLFKLNFHINDARKSILNINEEYDLIFLDAFTFSKAPELWTVEFMAELYKRLSPNGVLMTYSNSALVRNTFLENNFYIGKILDKNTGKCIGTIATKDKKKIEHPLSNYEMGLCSTRAGIPYHDQTLSLSKKEILKQREIAFKTSDLMTSSQYMRSRTSKNGESNE